METKTTVDPEFYFKYEPIGMKHVGLNHLDSLVSTINSYLFKAFIFLILTTFKW